MNFIKKFALSLALVLLAGAVHGLTGHHASHAHDTHVAHGDDHLAHFHAA